MSDKEAQAVLRDWLDQDGWSAKTNPLVDNEQFNIEFESQYRKFHVVRFRLEPHFIFIGGNWTIPPEEQAIFDKMDTDEREEMLEEMRMATAPLGLDWSGFESPIRKLGFQGRLPLDVTLTRAIFSQQVSLIPNTYILIVEIMKRHMRCGGHTPSGQQVLSQEVNS